MSASPPTVDARKTPERKTPEQALAEKRAAEKRQRLLVLALIAAAFLTISVAAALVLSKSWPLRQDLHRLLGWQADVAKLRNELSGSASLTGNDEKRSDLATLKRLRKLSRNLAADSGDSAVRTAAGDLEANLEKLEALLASPLAAARSESLADTVFTTVRSTDQLEAVLQPQIVALYRRLDRQWAALNWLVFAALMLGASNLIFLHLAERRRRELERARDEAAKLLTHDGLTGQLNRDGVMRLLRHELQRCRRKGEPLGLLLADLDRFRELNVLVGEEQGDVVLQQVAKRLGALVRPYDSMGRIGSDSFLILLPGCDSQATGTVAGRLLAAVSESDIELDRSRAKVTVSVSHLTLDPPADHDAELLVYRLRESLERLQSSERRGLIEVTIDGTQPIPLAAALQFDRPPKAERRKDPR